MAPPLPDRAERERIRRDHDTTLIVEAAAGTGKTTSVVSRVVEMVAAGAARIGQIAAITFTEKAAGELRLRIRQGLESRIEDEGKDPGAGARRERLEVALSQLEEASIGTIHAFCATVLRERPIEAGVDPDFQILTGADQRAFFDRVFRRFVDRQLENPDPGIARLLRRSRNPAVSPLEVLREAGRRLLDYRPFEASWKRRSWDAATAVEDIVDKPGGSGDKEIPSLFMIEKLYRSLPKDPPGTRPNWLVRSMAAAADLGREIRVRDAASGREIPDEIPDEIPEEMSNGWNRPSRNSRCRAIPAAPRPASLTPARGATPFGPGCSHSSKKATPTWRRCFARIFEG